jgi:ectoine hydroxylase-related dioxygenase (phytanoyl-CoA dioxygenase family)
MTATQEQAEIPESGDAADWARQFRETGLVYLPKLLTEEQVGLAEDAFNYAMAHPGPAAGTAASAKVDEARGEKFYTDISNAESWSSAEFERLLRDTPLADTVARIFGTEDVWFFGEQLFWKEGGEIQRTGWHQDASFVCFEGPDTAVVWICLDPVDKENSLEFIPGSHKWPTHNGFRLDPDQQYRPFYDNADMPLLPDIENEREKWDIVSWPIERGDVVIFHMKVLHGGAPTRPHQRRRTISLRMFGPDAHRVQRPPHPKTHGRKSDFDFFFFREVYALQPGDPISAAPGAMRVRPWSEH